MHPFVRAVADFASEQDLLPPDARVLVALSGGPDSCALLLALLEAAEHGLLPRPVAAAHFHHQLRGADADADAAFAGALCARLGLRAIIGLGAVERGASGRRRSPNDAARRARYAFLAEAARDADADTLATAHTGDDQAETVLLRVLRGTGPDGLAGIPLRRTLRPGLEMVRPLLSVSRAAVEAYCRDRNLTPRRDPSNERTDYARVRLRALLPALTEAFNPRLSQALCRLADAAARDADLLGQLTDALWQRVAAPAPRRVRLDAALRGEHSALRRRILLRALRHAAGDAAGAQAASEANVLVLETLLSAGGGAADLEGGVRAHGDTAGLSVQSPVPWRPPAPYCFPLPVPGRVWVRPAALHLRAEWAAEQEPPLRRARAVTLGYGTMDGGPDLRVRSARPGDRIAPLGMGGASRPVRDVMADAGWPAEDRAGAPLVVRADTDVVLWIVGLAQAEATRVGPGAQRILRLVAEPDC